MTDGKVSTRQIGDGKLPNKYWVSVSNDYYYFNTENGAFDWIGDLKLFKSEGKTIAKFNTYQEASEYIDEQLYLGMEYDGMTVNNISIEDRLSGEVYQQTREFYPVKAYVQDYQIREDLGFTKKKMAELGAQFK